MKKNSVKWIISGAGLALILIIVSLFSDTISSYFNNTNQAQTDTENIIEISLVYAYQNAQWNQAVESVIAAFEDENPNIIINYQINYEDEVYEDVLNKLNARGELGDIVQVKTPDFYAESGVLAPISDEVSKLVFSKYKYNDEVYAVGAIGSTVGIAYNKTLFNKLGLTEPKTYEEFLDTCEVIKQNGDTPIIVGGEDLWHMEFWVNHFLRTDILKYDSEWLNKCKSGTVTWNDNVAVNMFDHLEELFNSGYIDSNWQYTSDASLPYLMSQNNVGMVYTGSWIISQIQELNPEIEIGWFYLPDEQGDVIVGENRDVFWAVTKECGEDQEKYDAAMKFLEFFYTSNKYTEICENMNALYSTKSIVSYENSSDSQKDVIADFNLYTNHITSYIGNEDTPQGFEKKFLSIILETIKGEMEKEEALQLCDEYWNKYLEGE